MKYHTDCHKADAIHIVDLYRELFRLNWETFNNDTMSNHKRCNKAHWMVILYKLIVKPI